MDGWIIQYREVRKGGMWVDVYLFVYVCIECEPYFGLARGEGRSNTWRSEGANESGASAWVGDGDLIVGGLMG